VAQDIIGAKKLVNFTRQERLLDRLAGKLGASFGQVVNSLLTTPHLH
jgi:protease-4